MNNVIPWVLAVVFGALFLGPLFFTPIDDSDKGWFSRSGMSVYTDERTGLQYLGAGFGGALTPRLDIMGRHIQDPKWSARKK